MVLIVINPFSNCSQKQKHTMDHIKECERATVGREQEDNDDYYMHKILFLAAGTTLAMACLKQFLVIFFVEQWRSRVFLILNLILLAIFFTSINSNSSLSQENQESDENAKMKIQEKKKKNKQRGLSTKAIEHKKCPRVGKKTRDAHESELKPGREQEHIKNDGEAHKLSKEELNERVEAFIAMFRQHLVSDAIKCRNQFLSRPKQSELLYSHKRY